MYTDAVREWHYFSMQIPHKSLTFDINRIVIPDVNYCDLLKSSVLMQKFCLIMDLTF